MNAGDLARAVRRSVLIATLAAATAHAGGRVPLTSGVYLQPGDPHALFVRTTFGLLISHDDGCHLRWVCESAIGYAGLFDPKYAIARDGTIFATTFSGLRTSRDGGCTFTTNASLPRDTWVDAIDIGPTGEVWIGTATSGAPNDVLASSDGETFHSRGVASPAIWWKSVKVAPSRADRVYIAGYQVAGTAPDGGQLPPTAHVRRSDDDGAHWTPSPLVGVRLGTTPIVLIGAVDPQDADVVYLISVGAGSGGDRLYRSRDAGATWSEVLEAGGAISDVVVQDVRTVYVTTAMRTGPGGPAYASSDGGTTFAPLANAPQLACMKQRADGALVACAANWDPDFKALAISTAAPPNWQKLWRFVELAGPLACPAGTPQHDLCEAKQWPALKTQLGASGPTCSSNVSDAPVPATPRAPPAKKRGCCDAGGGSPASLVLVGIIALVVRRRR